MKKVFIIQVQVTLLRLPVIKNLKFSQNYRIYSLIEFIIYAGFVHELRNVLLRFLKHALMNHKL